MELLQLSHPILAILIGSVLSISVVEHMQGQPGRKDGDMTILCFGPVARFMAAASVVLPILCFVVAWQADFFATRAIFIVLGLTLIYAVTFSIYLSFFVEMSYDDLGIYYRSPTRVRIIAWNAVTRLGFSDAIQMHYLMVANGEQFWLSRCMNGFDDFSAYALRRMSKSAHVQTELGTSAERTGK